MPLWLGVGAGIGGLKYGLVDKPKYEKQKTLAAQTQRYSPWTGLQAQAPTAPDAFSDVLQYGTTGAMLGQSFQNADINKQMAQAYSNRQNNGGSVYNLGAPPMLPTASNLNLSEQLTPPQMGYPQRRPWDLTGNM